VGEEAQMQGALAYVRDRKDWPLPTCVVNLEVLGQNGGYWLWEEDGTVMLRMPVDPALNRALELAVEAVTGEQPVREPEISCDAFAFLRRGIAAATLGSFDRDLGGRGFHSALDNPGRVDPGRLAQAVEVLSRFLTDLDATEEKSKPCPGSPAITPTGSVPAGCWRDGHTVYVHCQGGMGRTGTVVGCYLVRHGMGGEDALEEIACLRRGTPREGKPSPFRKAQRQVVLNWPVGR